VPAVADPWSRPGDGAPGAAADQLAGEAERCAAPDRRNWEMIIIVMGG